MYKYLQPLIAVSISGFLIVCFHFSGHLIKKYLFARVHSYKVLSDLFFYFFVKCEASRLLFHYFVLHLAQGVRISKEK